MHADGSVLAAIARASGQSLFIGADAPKPHRPYLRSSEFICGSIFLLRGAFVLAREWAPNIVMN